jgi:hypothetical protein
MIQIAEKQLEEAVTDIITKTVQNLVSDPNYQESIRHSLVKELSRAILANFNQIDMSELIHKEVVRYVKECKTNIIKTGIADLASSPQLTVFDHSTVVENELVSNSSVVEQTLTVKNRIETNDLVVNGEFNLNEGAMTSLSEKTTADVVSTILPKIDASVTEKITDAVRNITVDSSFVLVNKLPIVQDTVLNSHITHSNIRTLGNLATLTVDGEAAIGKTVFVDSQRVGINTDAPDMALAVRDHEVSVSIGKHSEQTAFIGTTRLNKLLLGVNRRGAIEIDEDQNVKVKNLTVGNLPISTGSQVPSRTGVPGELVFNSVPSITGPLGWQCVGGSRWRTL